MAQNPRKFQEKINIQNQRQLAQQDEVAKILEACKKISHTSATKPNTEPRRPPPPPPFNSFYQPPILPLPDGVYPKPYSTSNSTTSGLVGSSSMEMSFPYDQPFMAQKINHNRSANNLYQVPPITTGYNMGFPQHLSVSLPDVTSDSYGHPEQKQRSHTYQNKLLSIDNDSHQRHTVHSPFSNDVFLSPTIPTIPT